MGVLRAISRITSVLARASVPGALAALTFGVAGAAAQDCNTPGFAAAAAANAAELDRLAFTPFGQPELGWRMYAPLVAASANTRCAPETPGFAAALARLQRDLGVRPADGHFTGATWAAIYRRMQAARPLVRTVAAGCPDPPDVVDMTVLWREESYGKTILLRSGAAAALRRMRAEALRDPVLKRVPGVLTAYSGFRSPVSDAARCLKDGNCDGRRRARCSPHRTGYAIDLYLGYLPPDSTAYIHRRAIATTHAYRWLAANAGRFGFVNYAFEPWHWEWTGAP